MLAVTLFCLHTLQASVKNGYDLHFEEARESLKTLQAIIEQTDTLSWNQKYHIKNKIAELLEYITYRELTQQLITQFRLIAPDLYNRVDSLTSSNGKAITVYVRFVSEKEMSLKVHGTTNIAHDNNDPDLYSSEFGPATVSVKIASVNRSLYLLAHEFGHAVYQVKNIRTYSVFYSKHYLSETLSATSIGHNSDDASGLMALEFEKMFRDRFVTFNRIASAKIESPGTLLGTIRHSLDKTIF